MIRSLSSFRIIIFGFLGVILTGCILLMLPFSTRVPGGASFLDALFTATSATCVTGLAVHDTAMYWSFFGQLVILTLIQIGGMGVITIAVFVSIVSGKKIGLMQRSTMQEAIAAPQVGGIVRLTGFIIRTIVILESVGAIVLAFIFCREFGIKKGIWYGVFHSVSAFCNAGFDLMGVKEPFSSLTGYQSQPVVNLTIMCLIITGGIGFLTWDDVKTHHIHFKKYRMQSKVILTFTAGLIFFPFLYFFLVEFTDLDLQKRILTALFQTVTPRTAGFNTTDLSKISEPGQILTIMLMLVGGSPGSTAGGMKTTTLAVLIFSSIAVFKRKENAQCFGRRISNHTIRYASAVLLMYFLLFLAGGFFISCAEQIPTLPCLFEAASAIGTVGLSLGITTGLGVSSRIILILLMFLGRVGGLTLVFAAFSGVKKNVAKLPMEKITVG